MANRRLFGCDTSRTFPSKPQKKTKKKSRKLLLWRQTVPFIPVRPRSKQAPTIPAFLSRRRSNTLASCFSPRGVKDSRENTFLERSVFVVPGISFPSFRDLWLNIIYVIFPSDRSLSFVFGRFYFPNLQRAAGLYFWFLLPEIWTNSSFICLK